MFHAKALSCKEKQKNKHLNRFAKKAKNAFSFMN